MNKIVFRFPVCAPIESVFAALTNSEGLDSWWTMTSSCEPMAGGECKFGFGPEYQWRAVVSDWEPDWLVEYRFTEADSDWTGTTLRFALSAVRDLTMVDFAHANWREANEHFRTTSFCWAMYLRLMRVYLETGSVIPYDQRLDA